MFIRKSKLNELLRKERQDGYFDGMRDSARQIRELDVNMRLNHIEKQIFGCEQNPLDLGVLGSIGVRGDI